MPRVSVILPVYNCEAYLQAAVQSVLAQSFSDFELIAIDDGSTDSSRKLLESFADQDSRVRVISRKNKGITPTLNEGIALARGDLIARMDGDDICSPERFARQVAYMDQYEEVVALGGQVLLIDEADRPLRLMLMPCDHDDLDGEHTSGNSMALICHPTAMLRTNAVRQVGGYLEDYPAAEDIDLWLRLAEIGKLANLPDEVLKYRQHTMSIGYAKRQSQITSAWRAAQSAAARRGLMFDAPEPRVTSSQKLEDIYQKWGWWALVGGNASTARYYAVKTLCHAPLRKSSWKLLACSLSIWGLG